MTLLTFEWLNTTFPRAVPTTVEKLSRHYEGLGGQQRVVANVRIQRHLSCCEKCEVEYDLYAIVEIVRDARKIQVA